MIITLLCRSLQEPTLEEVGEALCQAGYNASVAIPPDSLVPELDQVELRYAPEKMPITIRFGTQCDHNPMYEMGYDEWLWWQIILPNTITREEVRRLIDIDAQEDVDAGALQTVVDYIAAQADAVTAVENILSDQLI